jgi:hypothetical protein
VKIKEIRELGISWVRTSLVPPAVGFLSTYLLEHNVVSISATWLTTVVTLAFSALYYLIFRGVELLASNPKVRRLAGTLLGYAREDKWVK